MIAFSLMPWRRATEQGGLWNLFAWFGRACDQAAGVLLNPLVVAVFARSVERDPYRLSWLVVGFGLGWLFGAAVAPFLQRLTVRVMPWVVGGYIVRTAAIVLMTFAATDKATGADQRFQSILITYVAYAIATGIARTAQARHIVHGAPHRLWDARATIPTIGLALVLGSAALAMWTAMSSSQLSWNQSFGRIWLLASVALGVATLAAIREGADTPETPAKSHPPAHLGDPSPRRMLTGSSIVVIAGLAAISFVEVVALLHIFGEFRRQTVYLRGGFAYFAAGWVIGSLAWGPFRHRYSQTTLAQAAVGVGAIGMVLAIAIPKIAVADWFPDAIRGQTSLALLIYLMAFLFGLGIALRRITLADYFETGGPPHRWAGLLVSAGAALTPLLVGWATNQFSREWVLVAGVVLAMIVMTALGLLPGSAAARVPSRIALNPARHALLPRQ